MRRSTLAYDQAMLRNPETAYLVSDEEFDRQLDELGWSTIDTASRLGMYVEVGMYNLEKKIRDAFRSLLELTLPSAIRVAKRETAAIRSAGEGEGRGTERVAKRETAAIRSSPG